MTTLSRLIAAATLISATALAPGLAAADERHDRHQERDERRGPAVHDRGCGHEARLQPPPAPAWAYRDDLRWDGRGWVKAEWRWQERGERFGQARAVRLELAGLDRDRAAYHARFAHRPARLARYDAQYLERRAQLERQLQRLTMYAWR